MQESGIADTGIVFSPSAEIPVKSKWPRNNHNESQRTTFFILLESIKKKKKNNNIPEFYPWRIECAKLQCFLYKDNESEMQKQRKKERTALIDHMYLQNDIRRANEYWKILLSISQTTGSKAKLKYKPGLTQ